MRCLTAENQRRAVLAALPPGGSMLEWGAGGTTLWLLERLQPGQTLITVEHDANWAARLGSHAPGWAMVHATPSLEVGANATHWEENPAGLLKYVNPVPLDGLDVFLIDGIARGACLAAVLLNAKAGAKVFLHDYGPGKREDWYAWAVAAGARRILTPRVIEPDPDDYPSPMWACDLK